MKHLLCITSCLLMFLLGACDQRPNNNATPSPPSAAHGDAAMQRANIAKDVPHATSKVTLAFDEVPLQDLAPFLEMHSGKRVSVSPDFGKLRPKYSLTLISSEVITRDEAFKRIIAKLRSDGLEVREDQKTIEIGPGDYLNVWKPERTRVVEKFDPPIVVPNDREQTEPKAITFQPPPALSKEQVDRMDKTQVRESLRQVAAARRNGPLDAELQERLKREFDWLMERLRELE
jgi:hypothetical protein